MKQRVVFLFYHGMGHILAVLKIARILEEANYEVYFAGTAFFQSHVLTLGFKFYLLKSYPFGYGFEKWVNTVEKRKHVTLASLRDRISDRLYHEREVDLFWMIEELKPNTILIDSRQATDFIVMYNQVKKREIRVGIVHPMLPLHFVPGRPPLNSDAFPNDKAAVKKAERQMKWNQFKSTFKKKLIWLGFDERYIIQRRLKRNSTPEKYISKHRGLLNFALREIDQFIISPKEFDFPDFEPEPNQHYVGFMTFENRNVELEKDFKDSLSHILAIKEKEKSKLIYCSFGTIEPKEKVVMSSFLRKVVAVTSQEQFILILSLRANDEDISEFKLAKNVFTFKSVPQLEVLKYSDVFITHCGMNSIKEAVLHEVPMLAYPIHPEFDPYGNAARIAYNKLGLRGNAMADTPNEIRLKIKEILSNPIYRKNIQALKRHDMLYTASNFMKKFLSIKAPS
ncbi:glycosyltransferase [Chryseolinea sp. H1M3-3]|uniref:glycosyltransferase n=1 Tax=Chryseolinea sp. H1M3-3 TaxID=3034144 RepID=UPI0023EBD779|nr:glycosyltransferase [Chryseolinea sp. H1M3-3]